MLSLTLIIVTTKQTANLSTQAQEYFGKDLEAMSFAINYSNWILSEFQPYLGDNIAEIGAGAGNFSKLLLKTRIKTLTAFEPSDNMFPLLDKAISHDVRATTVNDFFDGNNYDSKFNSILYINVLEHIHDDKREIANAYRALDKDGYLLIFVPALPWLFSNFDKMLGHYRRYLKNPLTTLVTDSGFTVKVAKYFDVAGILPWYINFVLLKNSLGSDSVNLYDRLVIPPMRRLESIHPPPIGKNILIIAKK